ncbi:hypothetical protein EHI8A_014830 [Entamoeba histolytica HM-1:IMSS-B]|uniref:MIF4G domain-containing protein n=6 Tax=Entamoeba histolytica TaxID=5759 RepID=C4M807_ENTH1|nr:hypothetical protein EHI_143610 [Entamoeba histolytica HM-1:IMSS]EMD43388.1 Hypothetical protein EHI5A_037020 [Entamoeba histolytica KU27]EMH72357.1 hypothetical protein EHI8A_014830 [Entamoeba histolytica HM-1:IMSS-B]EMS17221.1 hypothetical protein KM1_045760 [Entamoeba histolytica HM-3:IMSS]ENY65262.1 hypothetical protein EHI7A_018920 [Entamoeba histolytica HM-1:IMSS-A]GAT97695.1 hypothetical protein CL6EHI_143610 [Entamoeba histolytica]|eukprot:XP_652356.1 hypothetical protein EHI_143610 [Entamoeba histolytica HM-1:IMSS]
MLRERHTSRKHSSYKTVHMTNEDRLVRLCHYSLEYTSDSNAPTAWIIKDITLESNIENIRSYAKQLPTDITTEEQEESYARKFIECSKLLSTKQGMYAYLLFLLTKIEPLKQLSKKIINKIITEIKILSEEETDVIEFKNIIKFICECYNMKIFAEEFIESIYKTLLNNLEGNERTYDKDQIAHVICGSCIVLKNKNLCNSIMEKVYLYIQLNKNEKTYLIKKIFNSNDFLKIYLDEWKKDVEGKYNEILFDYSKYEKLNEEAEKYTIILNENIKLKPMYISFEEIIPTTMENNFSKMITIEFMTDVIQTFYNDPSLLLMYVQLISTQQIDFTLFSNILFVQYLLGIVPNWRVLNSTFSRMLLFIDKTFAPVTQIEIKLFEEIEELPITTINRFAHYLSNKYISMNFRFTEPLWKKYENKIKEGIMCKYFFTIFFNDLTIYGTRDIESDMISTNLRKYLNINGQNEINIDNIDRSLFETLIDEMKNKTLIGDINSKLSSTFGDVDISNELLAKVILSNFTDTVSSFDGCIQTYKQSIKDLMNSKDAIFIWLNLLHEMNLNIPLESIIMIKRLIYFEIISKEIVIEWILTKIGNIFNGIHYIEFLVELISSIPNNSSLINQCSSVFETEAKNYSNQFEQRILYENLIYFNEEIKL